MSAGSDPPWHDGCRSELLLAEFNVEEGIQLPYLPH